MRDPGLLPEGLTGEFRSQACNIHQQVAQDSHPCRIGLDAHILQACPTFQKAITSHLQSCPILQTQIVYIAGNAFNDAQIEIDED